MSRVADIDYLQAKLVELGIVKFVNSEGMSTHEWGAEWGMDQKNCREMIRRFAQAGWVTVGRKTVKALDGRNVKVPVYKIEVPESAETRKPRSK